VAVSFNSPLDYFKFAGAKGFCDSEQQHLLNHSKNSLEKLGDILIKPSTLFVDYTLKNIRNPLMITALTVAAIAVVTLIFYPATVVAAVGTALPFIFKIQPWMIKFALFTAVEANILGLGLRTLGRLTNSTLMTAWNAREIQAVAVGTQVITR